MQIKKILRKHPTYGYLYIKLKQYDVNYNMASSKELPEKADEKSLKNLL